MMQTPQETQTVPTEKMRKKKNDELDEINSGPNKSKAYLKRATNR